jgi:hypothetical protein
MGNAIKILYSTTSRVPGKKKIHYLKTGAVTGQRYHTLQGVVMDEYGAMMKC